MRNGTYSGRSVDDDKSREVVAICYQQFAPYHVDRIAALDHLLGETMKVYGIEYSDRSTTYAWARAKSNGFERITLFPGKNWEKISALKRMRALLSCLMRIRAKHVFLINYHIVDTFLSAVVLRLLGKSPYIMMASQYSDKDRLIWKEHIKRWLFIPYVGGITSGDAHSKYLKFLGVRMRNFHTGLDTLSIDRVRACSGSEPAPGGHDFSKRHFTILARMVPEKDIPTALHAYARYRQLCEDRGIRPRDLVLCGDGPERGLIESIVRERNIRSVIFYGFVNDKEVCETLASTLALLLPSVSEPWGLVINEAVAMGVPILCSNVCGAVDELVHTGVNGFAFAPGEVEGLSNLMFMLSSNEEAWKELAAGSLRIAPLADCSRFADAVAAVMQARTRVPLARKPQDVEGRRDLIKARAPLDFGRVLGSVD